MNTAKLNRVLEAMKKHDIPQLIVADPASIFYLTGRWFHPGERMIVLLLKVNGEHKLVNNKLFPVEEDLGIEIVWYDDVEAPVEVLARCIDRDQKVGVDKIWPARFLIRLMELGAGSEFINGSFIVDYVRMIKDEEEQKLMRESSRLNDLAMERLIPYVVKGLTEQQLADQLIQIYAELGVYDVSFPPICAYGANGADPHHGCDKVTTGKTGDCVVLDIGGIKDDYCSDMTRTVFIGTVSDKARDVYETVLEANLRGIAAAKPGNRMCDVDRACRDYIESKGYGQYFTHRTGHCIGMEDHEFGDVSSINEDIIRPGMVFSVEPGIYLPGEVGVRIEDLVIITEDGCEVINHVDKSLRVVPER